MHELSDEEYEAATARGDIRRDTEPRATTAFYDRDSGFLMVDLWDGSRCKISTAMLQALKGASQDDLSEIEIDGLGFNLHWPRLNADIYVPSLAKGIYGTRAWMAEIGNRTAS